MADQDFEFLVTVTCETEREARLAMAARFDGEVELGFNYTTLVLGPRKGSPADGPSATAATHEVTADLTVWADTVHEMLAQAGRRLAALHPGAWRATMAVSEEAVVRDGSGEVVSVTYRGNVSARLGLQDLLR